MSGGLHAEYPVLRTGSAPREADLVLVLLHGRGADARDMLQLAAPLSPSGYPIAVVAPQAASRSWYPESFLAPRRRNQPWLDSALERVEGVVEDLLAEGVPSDRIAVGGFSQGACLACEAAARRPRRYAGLLVLTGGLIGDELQEGLYRGDFDDTPALLSSGDPDPHVPWSRVESTAAVLRRLGARVDCRRWPGRPHSVLQKEIDLGRALLAESLERLQEGVSDLVN